MKRRIGWAAVAGRGAQENAIVKSAPRRFLASRAERGWRWKGGGRWVPGGAGCIRVDTYDSNSFGK